MKTLSRLIFLLLALLMTGGSAQAQVAPKKVAVYVTGDDVEASIRKIIGAKLVTAITSSGKYAAVERSSDFLAALSKENDYQTSGEVRDNQIAQLGRKFGVKYVVVADVTEAFDELFIASRLINVETGLVERAYDTNGQTESMDALLKLSQDIASGLLKGIKGNTQNGGSNRGSNLNGHEYVDLGLPSGLKWATMNVGATSPSDYGSYFAWGETNTKYEYTSGNSRTRGVTYGDIGGNVQFDAARANWGGTWRMPTRAECDELVNCCSWAFITMGNHNGYKVIGPNGNYIFLPAAGWRYGSSLNNAGEEGCYLTSSPEEGNSYSAYMLFFNGSVHKIDFTGREYGMSVRPVSN